MKYTKDDVIIWADDPRLEGAIGKECYYLEWELQAPNMLLKAVNRGDASLSKLRIVSDDNNDSFPFGVTVSDFEYGIPFIILKDEQKEKSKKNQKKVVPFDFSLMEDRDAVLGKRIYSEKHKDDRIVSKITYLSTHWYADNIYTEELLASYVFADGNNKGKPVGKEIKE